MGLVRLSRALWRCRLAVSVGALIAIAVAIAGLERAGGGSPTSSSHTEVLIDTPKSLLATARPYGSATIYPRARLVAELTAGDEAKEAIARRAGLPVSEVAIAGPGAAAPPFVVTALSEQAIAVAKPQAPYLVSIEMVPGQPILSIDADAPQRSEAVALGRAVLETLPSVAAAAPGAGNDVAIERWGKPTVRTNAPGGGKIKAVGGATALFLAWCLGCVVLDRLFRRRRNGPRTRRLEEATS